MNCALVGNGKTGSKLAVLLPPQHIVGPYDSRRRLNVEEVRARADVVIVFVPANAVNSLIEDLIACDKPILWGTTGYLWKKELDNHLQTLKRTWVVCANFSLGMQVLKPLIEGLGNSGVFLADATWAIEEIHHTQKKDAPSGTALRWQAWLGKRLANKIAIKSHRVADEAGVHRLKVSLPYEEMTLEHKALDRRLFAKGALWAAKHILAMKQRPYGIVPLETLTEKFFSIGSKTELTQSGK